MRPVSIGVGVHRNTDGDTPSGFVSDLVENPEDSQVILLVVSKGVRVFTFSLEGGGGGGGQTKFG